MHIVIIDMDDTLAQYKQAFMLSQFENPEIKYPQSQYGFFANLQPMPNAISCVKRMLLFYDVDIKIVTRPSTKNLMSYTEKAAWVLKHLGQEFVDRLNFVTDKTLFKGDFNIDDNEWLGFEGEWIKFNASGDRLETEWDRVYDYITAKLTPRRTL